MRSTASHSVEIKKAGPSAIAEAENEVIFSVVQEQSPDLTPVEVRNFSGENSSSTPAFEEDEEEEERAPLTVKIALRALWGTKKDVLNVLGSGTVMGVQIWRLVRDWQGVDGGRWEVVGVVAWVRAFGLDCE